MATVLYPGIAFSPQATLTNNLGAADTIIEVSDASAFPPAPNLATIGTDEEGETVLYTAKTETALSGCQRGIEGTAKAWTAGERIGRNFTAKDHADLIAAVSETREAATTAADAATAAGEAAKAAQDAAQDAQEAASAAEGKATEAAETAEKAAQDAGQAKKDAQTAADAASTAQGAAETAQNAATSASTEASNAKKEAGEAKKTAEEALETAQAAGGLYPQIIVTVAAGSVVTCSNGSESYEQTSTGAAVVFNVPDYGTWSVSAERDGLTLNPVDVVVDTVKQYDVDPTFESTITVNVASGSTVLCVKGAYTQTKTSTGSAVFTVREAGTYTIYAYKNGLEESGTVRINASGQTKTISLVHVNIYGVSWDGSSTTKLTRGDDAALFTDPVPAVGNGAGSSPFDNRLPWSGMTKVTDGNNVLVKIPKYWVKVSHAPFKVQIADKATPGYQVSPAHRDRGDGKGERDVVYIGRYECDSSYMSRSGQDPKTATTLATFRSGIHALGSEYWQADYALQLTWWFLYIVEYANWDGQAAIGKGISEHYSSKTGATDSMTYHTGRAAGTDGQTAVQYRNIENPWGNVREWRDGIIFSDTNICTYNNPANFSDAYNGTGAVVRSNKRAAASGWIKAWGHDTNDPSFIYPSEVGESETTFVPDYCSYSINGQILDVGGCYGNRAIAGPFYVVGYFATTEHNGVVGSRLQKLPNAT